MSHSERERRTVTALLELSTGTTAATATTTDDANAHLDLLLDHARQALAPYAPVTDLAATSPSPQAPLRATTDAAHTLGALEQRTGHGPLTDALSGRTPGETPLTDGPHQRWPVLAARARALGLHRLVALPLCARTGPGDGGTPLGALVVYRPQRDPLPEHARYLLGALTVAAGVRIRHRLTHARVAELQHALDARILIEQAKGMLAERSGTTPDEAFTALRHHARTHRRKLHDVARAVLDGAETL